MTETLIQKIGFVCPPKEHKVTYCVFYKSVKCQMNCDYYKNLEKINE